MASGMSNKYYFKLTLNAINTVVQKKIYYKTLKIPC